MGRSTQWHNIQGSPILVTENVVEYRHCIKQHVGRADVALEVGCAEGVTTVLLARHARQAVGIDKSADAVAKASARHAHMPNVAFLQVEAWDLAAVLRLADAAGVQFSMVCIDVSGSRRAGDVDNLVTKYEQVFKPRLFVVKSYQLKKLINRCHLFFCPISLRHQPAAADAVARAAGIGLAAAAQLQVEAQETGGAGQPAATAATAAAAAAAAAPAPAEEEEEDEGEDEEAAAAGSGAAALALTPPAAQGPAIPLAPQQQEALLLAGS